MPPRLPDYAAASPAEPLPATRDRLLGAMTDSLRTRGLHGTGLTELLDRARAPKGVLYHHFPGGKTELAATALRENVARTAAALERMAATGTPPVTALRRWLNGALKQLEASGFERGCPLAAVALESTSEDLELRQALADAFALLRERLGEFFVAAGLPRPRALPLATLAVSAYEGALIQARVAGNRRPMVETSETLLALIANELERR